MHQWFYNIKSYIRTEHIIELLRYQKQVFEGHIVKYMTIAITKGIKVRAQLKIKVNIM